MSRLVKSENGRATVAPTKLVEEKNSINLSEEAQLKLFELVLNTPSVSSENLDKQETPATAIRKAS
jgi:hypothetical protein